MSWNYRVVADYHNHRKESLRGWTFSIRDVFYTKAGKAKSWGAEPQHPIGEEAKEVFEDLELMNKAMFLPLLIETKKGLVEYPSKSPCMINPIHLKNYEPKQLT